MNAPQTLTKIDMALHKQLNKFLIKKNAFKGINKSSINFLQKILR